MLTPLLFVEPFLSCFLPMNDTFDVELERLDAGERCLLPTDFPVEIERLDAGERCFLPIYNNFRVVRVLERSDAIEDRDCSELAQTFVKEIRKVENKARSLLRENLFPGPRHSPGGKISNQ